MRMSIAVLSIVLGGPALLQAGGAVNHPPDAPVPLSPPDGAVVGTVTPTLEAGAFSDPDPGDGHRTSQWQLALDEGFVDIVCDSGSTNHHRYSVTVGSGASLFADCTLDDCTTYYWRVRYSDDYSPSAWSDWSEVRWLHTSVFCPHPCGCVNGDSESFDLKDFLGDLLILGLSLFLLAAWRSTKGI